MDPVEQDSRLLLPRFINLKKVNTLTRNTG